MANDGAIVSVFPQSRGTGQAAVFLYRASDPLAVDIILWGRQRRSIHRSVMRSDLLDVVAGGQMVCGDVTIGRVTPRFLRVLVQSPQRTYVSIISVMMLVQFLEESVELVPASEEAETELLSRLARDLISAS